MSEFVREPAVTPDGRFLAGPCSESDVALVESATGKTIGRLTQEGDVSGSFLGTFNNMKLYPGVELSPDGRFAVVSGLYDESRKSISRVHQLEPLKELGVVESCRQVKFAPDGLSMVVMTSTERLRLWSIQRAE